MAEYTRALDEQITRQLESRGHVTPDMLAGVSDADGERFLQRYAAIHGAAGGVEYVDSRLTKAMPEPDFSQASTAGLGMVSPVDQVLSMPQGKSRLDVQPSGRPYPRWAWWLPLSFGLLGGFAAWLFVREANRRTAKHMLITGAVLQVVSTIVGAVALSAMGPSLPASLQTMLPGTSSQVTATWPASPYEQVALYYFGDTVTPACATVRPVVDALKARYGETVDLYDYANTDTDSELGSFAKKQGITVMPTFVLVSSSGKELQRWTGVQTEEALAAAVDSAVASGGTQPAP